MCMTLSPPASLTAKAARLPLCQLQLQPLNPSMHTPFLQGLIEGHWLESSYRSHTWPPQCLGHVQKNEGGLVTLIMLQEAPFLHGFESQGVDVWAMVQFAPVYPDRHLQRWPAAGCVMARFCGFDWLYS